MVDNINKKWAHEEYEFLKPSKIRDKNKNRPGHPDYDSRTLYVPPDFHQTVSPAMHQWWNLKSSHFDCILFFKVGKFYELYHQDAVVGVEELGFTYMGKDNHAHSGFPESAYEKMASTLVERGYKVARVEQTENPAMMEERCKKTGQRDKYSKVMKREVCQITDRGTQIFSNGQQKMTTSSDANFLLSIAEMKKTPSSSRYGVCFVDTSIGDFTIGEFDDDQQCSRLLTLMSHYSPVLVLYERNGKAPHTEKIIKGINALKEPLTNEKQMWGGAKTLKFLTETVHELPPVVKAMQEDHLKPAADAELAFKALGGTLWYLERNLLVKQVLALANFNLYIPPDEAKISEKIGKEFRQKTMVLDNITLANLNVVGKENSLFLKMDFCCTQFGKRLLMENLCAPTANVDEIRGRQEAVKELFEDSEILQNCRSLFSSLNVDLERSLAQIHQFGNKNMKDHPASRAILYETQTYGKNKITDFASALNAFESLMELPEMFKDCKSVLLKSLTQTNENGGRFIDMTANITKFKGAFDLQEAMKLGKNGIVGL
jgi:DNA mismatch repair protein MSH6